MKHLIGKVLKVNYNEPAKLGSARDEYPNIGRLVKVFTDDSCVLIVNPECQSELDMHSSGKIFKWGTWIDVSEATFEEVELS